jgi:hypothetical protein
MVLNLGHVFILVVKERNKMKIFEDDLLDPRYD